MGPSISELPTPDDGGRDAFERFRFQAHVAFPFCLRAATDGSVASVVCEHFEDLMVDEPEALRFIQIKTRNADYGPWRFKDLCRPNPGALVSVLRTHRSLADLEDPRQVIYEVRLEGILDRKDPISRLSPGGEGADEEMARELKKAFRETHGLGIAEARAVLSRVLVRAVDTRETIDAKNLQVLAALAGDRQANELRRVYQQVIELICSAMEGKLGGDEWPRILFEADDPGEEMAARLEKKTLDTARLTNAFATLLDDSAPAITPADLESFEDDTALVRKLRLAGAGPQLVQQARKLRALATRREMEIRSSDLTGAAAGNFLDLDERLLTVAVSVAETHKDDQAPAGAIFNDLLKRFEQSGAQYDPRSLFGQDAMTLMGGVCELSDECVFGWGRNA
jgi:Cap4 dsDNA endonuclease